MLSDIGFLLKVIQEYAERHANQIFKPVDLTSSQVRVLRFLRGRGEEPTSQKDIEEYLHVSHPTVVGIVQRLEHKGFVRTEFDGPDKRQKFVYRTEREEELFRRMRSQQNEMEHLLTRNMTEEQIEELRELLKIVYENVKGENKYDKDLVFPGKTI